MGDPVNRPKVGFFFRLPRNPAEDAGHHQAAAAEPGDGADAARGVLGQLLQQLAPGGARRDGEREAQGAESRGEHIATQTRNVKGKGKAGKEHSPSVGVGIPMFLFFFCHVGSMPTLKLFPLYNHPKKVMSHPQKSTIRYDTVLKLFVLGVHLSLMPRPVCS